MTFHPSEFARVRAADCRAEVAVLTGWVAGLPAPCLPPCDPGILLEVARLNKLLMLIPREAAALPPGCGALAATVDMARLRVMRLNRQGLRLAAEISHALEAAGVAHLHLKGPLQQIVLYGDALRKPAGDVDLLVRPADRAAAVAVLQAAGFAASEAALASWWTHFLGEQHFQRAGCDVVIDLHHALQQPGLPRPRGLGGFLDRAMVLTVDGSAFRIPSAQDRCLLAAITLMKALLAAEPGGGAVADLHAAMQALTGAERVHLPALANASGLDRTLTFALHIVDAALGSAHARAFGPSPLPHLAAADLRDMLFQPWCDGLPWPRRRQILAALCGPDLIRFATEAGRQALSIGYRQVLGHVARWPRKPQGSPP